MKKSVNYRRAAQLDGQAINLENALEATLKHSNQAYPSFVVHSEDCLIVKSSIEANYIFLHLVMFEKGSNAAVIEVLQTAGVKEAQPPADSEFIISQLFLTCSKNDVLWTCHNSTLRDSRVRDTINFMIAQLGNFTDSPNFFLEATLDEKIVKQLMHEGIEEISIGAGTFQDTLDRHQSGGVGKGYSAFIPSFSKRLTTEEVNAASNVSVKAVIRPGKSWSDIGVMKLMGSISSHVIDDDFDNEFLIKTKNGVHITRNEMRLKDLITVDGNKTVVDSVQIRVGLVSKYKKFVESGILEV